jgi:hypothetical protein
VHRIHTGRAMVTSQSIRKGVRSSRISRSKPQNDWESFSPATGIPKDVKGVIPLPTEMIRSNHVEPEVERLAQGGKTVEAPSPQQKYLGEGAGQGRTRKLGKPEFQKSRVPDRWPKNYSCAPSSWSLLEDRAVKAGEEQGKWIPQE